MFLFNAQHTKLIQPDAEFYNLVAPHAPPLTVFVEKLKKVSGKYKFMRLLEDEYRSLFVCYAIFSLSACKQ